MKALLHRLVEVLVRVFFRALSFLPLPAVRWIARMSGAVADVLRLPPAKTTAINLRLCFPQIGPDEHKSLVRKSLQQTACIGFELGAVWHWSATRCERLAESCEGEDAVADALMRGYGVLLLVPHFGNWEYLSLHFGNRFNMTALYDPPRIQALEPLIRRARERTGTRLLPISRSGIRSVFETLDPGRAGASVAPGVVGLLPDQVPEPSAGVYAPLFGNATLTMTFAHRLVMRTQPKVFLCSAQRSAAGFRIRYDPAEAGMYDADPVVHATALNHGIEKIVMRDIAQYQWEYKRFKRPPPGEQSPYPK